MENSVKIRKLLQDITKTLDGKVSITYQTLTKIITSMETYYNLQDDEVIKQLELILKAVKN